MDKIILNIKESRIKKGYSHEYMADVLGISQVSYSKIEKGGTKLTVERLYKIADILEVLVGDLLEIPHNNQLNQTNIESPIGYLQQIENFYQENKEQYQKITELYEARLKDKDAIIEALTKK